MLPIFDYHHFSGFPGDVKTCFSFSLPTTAFPGQVMLRLMLILHLRVLVRAPQLCASHCQPDVQALENLCSTKGNWMFPTWLTHPLLGLQFLLSRLLLIKHLSEAISRTAGLWPFMPAITNHLRTCSQGTNRSVCELLSSCSSIRFVQPIINQN